MTSLDIHVLTLQSTKPEWLERALDSIEEARALCSMEVSVHVVEGVTDHLGKSRKRGYSQGTAEYVTHVDHDDWLHSDALLEVERVLVDKPQAVTTGEFHVGLHEIARPNDRHHLAVFRRDWLEAQPYEVLKFWPDPFLLSLAESVHIPKCLYYLRLTQDSASRKQRHKYRAEAAAESCLIQDKNLILTECMTQQQIAALVDKEMEDG